jgi:hypothetical protein
MKKSNLKYLYNKLDKELINHIEKLISQLESAIKSDIQWGLELNS